MTPPGLNYRLRLAETVAWCFVQPLESAPEESDDVKRRRQTIDRAFEMIQAAHRRLKDKALEKLFKSREYLQAQRLLDEADPSSIHPLRDQLRTPSLRPSSAFTYPQATSERIMIVEEVANRRAELLTATGRYPNKSDMRLTGGRLLLYAPDDNLADGAAVYASMGFFDVDNIPPWDTWICYTDKYLVSWVPPVLEELVTAGINVNPEECIRWSTPDFVKAMFTDPAL